MTGGELIEVRLRQKLCIRCGIRDAPKSPYLCDDCQQELDTKAKRKRDGVEPRTTSPS